MLVFTKNNKEYKYDLTRVGLKIELSIKEKLIELSKLENKSINNFLIMKIREKGALLND